MLIIFDCDGVLVDSEVIANRVMAALLSQHGYPVTAAECQDRFVGHTILGVIDMVAEAGVTLPDDFEDQLIARDHAAFAKDLQPVAGVQVTLERLHDRPKCVASSGRMEKIRNSLTTTGLLKYLDPHLFSARNVAQPKPAPDIFFHAASRINTDPSQCTVIEDTPVGVEGAKRAGMRVFGFIGASHRVPDDAGMLRAAGADMIFDDMTQLPQMLRAR